MGQPAKGLTVLSGRRKNLKFEEAMQAMKHFIPALGLAIGVALAGAAMAQEPPSAKEADAKAGVIRVILTSAVRRPINAVLAQAEAATKKKIILDYGSARGDLKEKILAGEEFDVAIMLPDVNEALFKAGKIFPDVHNIASVPIAIVLRGNTRVDVSTPAALKQTLLKARSVRYSPSGVALTTVKNILAKLDIADKIQDSSPVYFLRKEIPLAPGEYEIALFPLSEVMGAKTVQILGLVIPQFQIPEVIQASVGKSGDAVAARELIRFLQGPAINAALKDVGMNKSVVNETLK